MKARKYKVDRDTETLNAYRAFTAKHGDDHFPTEELASEYSRLRRAAWGPNLISMGVRQNPDGTYNAYFNVWD